MLYVAAVPCWRQVAQLCTRLHSKNIENFVISVYSSDLTAWLDNRMPFAASLLQDTAWHSSTRAWCCWRDRPVHNVCEAHVRSVRSTQQKTRRCYHSLGQVSDTRFPSWRCLHSICGLSWFAWRSKTIHSLRKIRHGGLSHSVSSSDNAKGEFPLCSYVNYSDVTFVCQRVFWCFQLSVRYLNDAWPPSRKVWHCVIDCNACNPSIGFAVLTVLYIFELATCQTAISKPSIMATNVTCSSTPGLFVCCAGLAFASSIRDLITQLSATLW